MMKVMVVDDEILIRVGVKSCIEWERYGFEIVAQAEDGKEALDLIENKHPDIVLTDIKMPNMDGLELIRVIREKHPHIKVIVLSCYNEMDYVKQAMKLGAEDYLLKLSIQPEMLLQIMNRVKEAVVKQREDVLKAKTLENEIRVNKSIIKDNLYKKFLDESVTPALFLQELNSLGIQLSFSSYTIICLRIDDYANAPMKSSLEDHHLLKFSFRNIVEEVLEEYFDYDMAEVDNGTYMLIAACGRQLDIAAVCKNVNNSVKKYLNITISFGISESKHRIDRLKEAYLEAYSALGYKFFSGRQSITQFSENHRFRNEHISMDIKLENVFLNLIENLDADGAQSVIEGFTAGFPNTGLYSPESIKFSFIEVIHSLSKLAKKYNLQDNPSYHSLTANISNILDMETMEDLKTCLYKHIHNLIYCLSGIKLDRERPEIVRVKAYILDHIDENVSLENAAEMSNMSKCYFSTIFKREAGESYTDYINRVKMEKAKELIFEFDLKNYEAAEKVGIYDESYFSKLFKKYIGETPSSIRNK